MPRKRLPKRYKYTKVARFTFRLVGKNLDQLPASRMCVRDGEIYFVRNIYFSLKLSAAWWQLRCTLTQRNPDPKNPHWLVGDIIQAYAYWKLSKKETDRIPFDHYYQVHEVFAEDTNIMRYLDEREHPTNLFDILPEPAQLQKSVTVLQQSKREPELEFKPLPSSQELREMEQFLDSVRFEGDPNDPPPTEFFE